MDKYELALQYHKTGFNCAQSVVLPFSSELNVDKVTLIKGLEGFGGGMGTFLLTCGALSGAVYAAGILNSDGSLTSPSSKKTTYAITKNICESFSKKCGSTQCGEIKGSSTGKPLSSCNDCILFGVRLIEKLL